jgi:hypothetical protein
VGIPGLQKPQSVLDNKQPQAVQFVAAETMRFRKIDWVQPELSDTVTVLNVDVRRL